MCRHRFSRRITLAASSRKVTNVLPILLLCLNDLLLAANPPATRDICKTKTKYCMILVFISVIGFFGMFFWQAERLNHDAEKKNLHHEGSPYLWPQKVSKHA
jgi:hypothetical protein